MTLTLIQCAQICAQDVDFVMEWERLRKLTLPRTPIDQMIDEATGRNSIIARQFIADVDDLIFSRLPDLEESA